MNSQDNTVSLNESPDCEVESIVDASDRKVTAFISVHLSDEQLDYFSRNMEYLTTDLHSTKARMGINQSKQGDFKIENHRVSYTAEFRFYIPEYCMGLGIDQLITPGLKVGKIYLRNPELKYTASELINLICNRTIIVPKGTRVLEEGSLLVPVMPFIHLPNTRVLTPDYLKAAVMKIIPRDDLYFAQPEREVERVVIPAQGGVISHTTLFTQSNEIFIADPEHTDARVGSKHTNGIIYLEFVGNGKDIVKEDIHVEVFKPAPVQNTARKRFYIDKNSSFLDRFYRRELLVNNRVAVTGKGVEEKIMELSGRKFDCLLKSLAPGSTLILRDFPNRLLASYLIVAADLGLLSNLIFKKAPEEDYFFSSEHMAFMEKLQDMGTCISWKNEMQGDLVLHNRFFMRSSILPSFDEAFGSRKFAAIYGTAGGVDSKTETEIVDSIRSFKEFHGGICGILTGGSAGSIMSFVSETTKSLGMLTGAVYWKIPGVDFYPNVDFAAYLGRNDLLQRQEILSDATEADIYFKGGVGTNLENAITFVKKKLGIGYYKPQIFVGDFYLPLKKWLNHLVTEETVDPKVFNSCYFVKHGKDIFKTLCRQFASEDRMICDIEPQ